MMKSILQNMSTLNNTGIRHVQQSLVIMAVYSPAFGPSWMVVSSLFAESLERVKRGLLTISQMPEMRAGILERVDLGEVRLGHGFWLNRCRVRRPV
jgi:hypothetical protein